jgi:hypothetical protein
LSEVLSFESELEQLRPTLGDARADALIARERREVFSIYPELRIAAWSGAMLLATAAGIVLKKNFDRIGPLALAMLIGAAAVACYAWVWWRRRHATLADDYVLLLGALLLSGDVAFIEQQFHLLDHHWPRHFLMLAIVHGVTAYAYRSKMLLSMSIAALAAWLGIEKRTLDFDVDLAPRAFLCTGVAIAWREAHRRLALRVIPGNEGEGSRADERDPSFLRVFEHFAANFALWGGLTLLSDESTFNLGCLLTIALAAVVMWWGFRQRVEAFVLYAFVYAVISADALVLRHTHDGTLTSLIVLLSMIGAVVVLATIHRRFHERRA